MYFIPLFGHVECTAVQKGVGDPKWTLSLDDEETVSGVALIPERLYVAARDGVLFAIGNR